MTNTREIRPILVKAIRILLTFTLVFYTSLRVEFMVAYAANDDSNEYKGLLLYKKD